jgi:hypothetical protein
VERQHRSAEVDVVEERRQSVLGDRAEGEVGDAEADDALGCWAVILVKELEEVQEDQEGGVTARGEAFMAR